MFLQKKELFNILDDRRNRTFVKPIFDKLQEFINSRVLAEFKGKPLYEALFNFFMELYRKLNIKNTMVQVFLKIREIRTSIEANVFSINYARQSIDTKNEELKIKLSMH